MMSIELIGYLAGDAGVIKKGGKDYLAFTMAVEESRRGLPNRTAWVDCTAYYSQWLHARLKKGVCVYGRGEIISLRPAPVSCGYRMECDIREVTVIYDPARRASAQKTNDNAPTARKNENESKKEEEKDTLYGLPF